MAFVAHCYTSIIAHYVVAELPPPWKYPPPGENPDGSVVRVSASFQFSLGIISGKISQEGYLVEPVYVTEYDVWVDWLNPSGVTVQLIVNTRPGRECCL